MKKKLLSLVLAATMLIGATMSVFAADGDKTESVTTNDTTVSGSVTYENKLQPVEIKVKITSTTNGKVLVNPYGEVVSGTAPNGETLVIPNIKFVNEGTTPVSLGLKGQISANNVKPNAALTKPAAQTTTHQVNVNVKFYAADGSKLMKVSGKDMTAVALTDKSADIANSPVLAKKDFTDTANKGWSDTAYVVFGGWTMAGTTAPWAATDTVNVITIYNLKLADESKLSTFGTS